MNLFKKAIMILKIIIFKNLMINKTYKLVKSNTRNKFQKILYKNQPL